MGAPKRKWTSEEEDALRAGVAKHGTGKWKKILKDPDFSHYLAARSNIHLKDKWRNTSVSASGQGSRDKIRTPKLKALPPIAPASASASASLDVSGPSNKNHAPHVEASILPEPNNETHQERPRNVLNVQSKQKAPVHNKRQGHKDENKQKAPMRNKGKRKVSYRISLAGAGTQWQDGVRRCTRKRVRPLEFWNGEQLVYGRVHDSPVTVVGCKYASPSKGRAEPTLKVESFVSNWYKVRFPSLF